MNNADAGMTEAALLAALEDAVRPALLAYFTAPWCKPCAKYAPVIEQLAHAGGAALPLYKINIDKYPNVATRFGVRGIPTTILLQHGAPRERVVGARLFTDMRAWLAGQGVHVASASGAPADAAPLSPRLQAFYGDAGLRDFLLDRLGAHLDAGHVVSSFGPYWVDGAGTFAAAMVHSSDSEVFERVNGLPYGVACVLDFLAIDNRADSDRLFAAITPATDLAGVPLRFVQAWLATAEHRWPEVLAVPGLDQLRRDWLAMSARWQAGELLPGDDWAGLQARAQALVSFERDPWRQLDDDVASMLAMLSPPPPPGDQRWQGIISARMVFSRARLLELNAGWNARDIALPVLKIRWLQAHVELNSEGQIDQDSLCRGQQDNPYNDDVSDRHREKHYVAYPILYGRSLRRSWSALSPSFSINRTVIATMTRG